MITVTPCSTVELVYPDEPFDAPYELGERDVSVIRELGKRVLPLGWTEPLR